MKLMKSLGIWMGESIVHLVDLTNDTKNELLSLLQGNRHLEKIKIEVICQSSTSKNQREMAEKTSKTVDLIFAYTGDEILRPVEQY